LIKVHLTEGGASVGRAGSVKSEQPTRFQPGDGISGLPLAAANGNGIRVIAQIVHTRSTVHHGITILSQVFRRLRTDVRLAPKVTDVTTVSLGSASSRGPPRVVAGLPVRVVPRAVTETLFTDTLTADDRFRMFLLPLLLLSLLGLLVATAWLPAPAAAPAAAAAAAMLTTLAIRVAAMRRTSLATAAARVRTRLRTFNDYLGLIYLRLKCESTIFSLDATGVFRYLA